MNFTSRQSCLSLRTHSAAPRVRARRIAAGDQSRQRRVGQGPTAPRMHPSPQHGHVVVRVA